MTVYEIDRRIEEILEGSINEETGELEIDTAELEQLAMDRATKLEHCALAYKNYIATADAIDAEIKNLKARKAREERRAENALKFLQKNLPEGEEINTPTCRIYRKISRTTEVGPEFVQWAEKAAPSLLNFGKPKPALSVIAKLIKEGEEVPYAWIAENNNLKVE